MDNQNGSIENNNRPSLMKMNLVFLPLILNYAVSLIVQFVFCGVILFGVVSNYVYASPEFIAIMEEAENIDTDTLQGTIDTIMTDEVVDSLTEETINVVTNNIALLTVCCAIASIPVFAFIMFRDKKKRGLRAVGNQNSLPIMMWGLIIVGSAALCLVLNNILTLSQLAETSQAYIESSENLYSISFPLQIIAWGILTPISEEILFRGVLFKRLRHYLRPTTAMFWSALLFGVYHGNVVQLIYAFISGWMFAWLYEKFGTIKAPMLAHICMNIVSLILTQYDLFIWMFEDPIRMTVITVASAALMASCYVLFTNMTRSEVIENNEY